MTAAAARAVVEAPMHETLIGVTAAAARAG
jgi:hypothetical protein